MLTNKPLTSHPADEIIVYPACISHLGGSIEGRIIKRRKLRQLRVEDGWRQNLTRSVSHLINRERKHVPFTLTFQSFQFVGNTDDEGYFKVTLPPHDYPAGWQTIYIQNEYAQLKSPCLVLSLEATVGVITDLDDTILVSEVTKKFRLITNTFLKNPLQREAVAGAAQVYRQLTLQPPHTPIFYLSATPRQLFSFVQSFLQHYNFPAGMIITRRLTRDAQGDSFNVKAYKTQKIMQLLRAFPHLKFKLIGDDGEHDPDIYHDIQTQFPHQIEGVWIRRIVHTHLKYPHQQDFETLVNL